MHDLDRTFLELDPTHAVASEFWSAPSTPLAREAAAVSGAPSPFAREVAAAMAGGAPSPFAREVAAAMAAGAPSPFMRGMSTGSRQPDHEVFDEVTEMELAADLLGAQSDHEMDHFLGGLLQKAGSFLGKALHSSVGQEILGGLKDIARKALPVAGAALGNLIVPGVGGNIGRTLAEGAGKALGLELEGMSPADQEFEVARRVVRLGAEAARHAAGYTPPTPAHAARAAQVALTTAARKHAPGLLGPLAGTGNGNGAAAALANAGVEQRGEWVRKGDRILLFGV